MRGVIGASRELMYWVAAAVWIYSATAWAQNYPSKSVRYVIPFPAGTGNDIVGRLLTDRLTRMWGQQVIVDNRVGASGTIGAAYVAKATPDGYTLLHCNIAPNAISPSMYAKMPYEHSDFAPITRIGMTPNIITVHPSVPFKSIKDLAAHAKSNPGKMSYSAGLVGTSPHLAMEWLKQRMKFDIVHIPYKNASQGTTDVIAGQLPVNITNFPFVVPFVLDSRLRGLAVTSLQRQSLLPNVPTAHESGVPDFEVNSWYGVCAPAGVPAALLDKLNTDITAVLRMPEIAQRLNELVIPPSPTSREEFDRFMRAEIARWAQVIKDAKIPKL
ncbi:MAG TPA: tripartite tricarboxylate transporter substrate binding protein [Burkholderiales bacterium]|nr:tripartite tricarboxylate transporter substrate binding protein [Burkholderiales bacterium]